MLSTAFFTLTVLAACALAQSSGTASGSVSAPVPSTSIPAGFTPCIMNCVAPAAQAAGCSSFADLPCVCTSSQFQQQAAQCLQQNCTMQEIQSALGLQSQECQNFMSGSGSATATGSTMATGSVTALSQVTSPSTGTTGSIMSTSAIVPPANSAAQTSSGQPTLTAPVGNSSGGSSSTSSAAAMQTSNAAMGKGDGVGVIGLFVAGLFGLAL